MLFLLSPKLLANIHNFSSLCNFINYKLRLIIKETKHMNTMKQFIFMMTTAMILCTTAFAQKNSSPREKSNDTIQMIKTGDTQTSSDSIAGVGQSKTLHFNTNGYDNYGNENNNNDMTTENMAMLVHILGIICGCSVPILLVFFIFYFRYKNRKKRYETIGKAIAAGQPIPEELLDNNKVTKASSASQGIMEVFIGIGIFVFLWAISGNFQVGAIGLLVMFIGIGQWIVANNEKRNNENKKNDPGHNKSANKKQNKEINDEKEAENKITD